MLGPEARLLLCPALVPEQFEHGWPRHWAAHAQLAPVLEQTGHVQPSCWLRMPSLPKPGMNWAHVAQPLGCTCAVQTGPAQSAHVQLAWTVGYFSLNPRSHAIVLKKLRTIGIWGLTSTASGHWAATCAGKPTHGGGGRQAECRL